jgi:hypothetical protein
MVNNAMWDAPDIVPTITYADVPLQERQRRVW